MAKEVVEKKSFNGKVTVDTKAKTVTIVLPLETPTLSASGKSYNVAGSKGNHPTGVMYKGKELTAGVNVYYSAKVEDED